MLNGFDENEEVETDGLVIDGLGSTSMGDGSMSPLASLYCSSNTSSMTTKRLPRYFRLCLYFKIPKINFCANESIPRDSCNILNKYLIFCDFKSVHIMKVDF